MGLYWRKSTKILPGVRINWSKNGLSISMGPKGAKINIGKRGTYVSGGIPDTGLYYRQKVGGGSKSNSSSTVGTNPPTSATTTQTTFGYSKQGCLVSIVASVLVSSPNSPPQRTDRRMTRTLLRNPHRLSQRYWTATVNPCRSSLLRRPRGTVSSFSE